MPGLKNIDLSQFANGLTSQPECQAAVYYSNPRGNLLPLDRFQLKDLLLLMLEATRNRGYALFGVDLHIVGDDVISALNFRFLQRTGPTNILSFPSGDASPGILVLSRNTFARECVLYRQKPVKYLIGLLAHGMAHLAGLDHGEAMESLGAACMAAVIGFFDKG